MPTLRDILRFYADGFKSMTVGRKLWAIIIIKLFIMFAILKVFFFPDTLAQKAGADQSKSDVVRHELLDRNKR